MNNEEIIRKVQTWQKDDMVHPMTCGNDSNHNPLYPVERDGKVILKCPNCEYIQNWIPEPVLIHSQETSDKLKKRLGIKTD